MVLFQVILLLTVLLFCSPTDFAALGGPYDTYGMNKDGDTPYS